MPGGAGPRGAPGPEEVLLDQNHVTHELGIKDCTYLMMGQMKVSADQTLLAFTLDTTGDEVTPCAPMVLRQLELFPPRSKLALLA